MIWTETNLILAIVGMVGLFSSALIFQRANRNASVYYQKDRYRIYQNSKVQEQREESLVE